jgi:hypothetical protein
MDRLALAALLTLGAFFLALPAGAQPHQRSGTAAGGPGSYGRPGELSPGEQPYGVRQKTRTHRRRPGELAPGEMPYRPTSAASAAAKRCRSQVLAQTRGSMGNTMGHRTSMYKSCMLDAGHRP